MSDGKWSGGIANRTWARPGNRYGGDGMTPAQRHDLYESVADESFWCDTCEAKHPLREHRDCRARAKLAVAVTGLAVLAIGTLVILWPALWGIP